MPRYQMGEPELKGCARKNYSMEVHVVGREMPLRGLIIVGTTQVHRYTEMVREGSHSCICALGYVIVDCES